jgi:hypothetical protein
MDYYHHTLPVKDTINLDFTEDEILIGIELLGISRFTDDLDGIIAHYRLADEAQMPK